jgi:hypothetical protein
MNVPQIQSIGEPPERHADRVVGEMIRWLIQARARIWPNFWKAVGAGNFGNPVGQQRTVARMRTAGHPFLTGIELEPAKRCRYSLAIGEIEGFDPDRQMSIDDEDALDRLPGRPWLAVRFTYLEGKGPGRKPGIEEIRPLLVSHHALSRLTQRCGARHPVDLILAVRGLCDAFLVAGIKGPDAIPLGHRMPFTLPADKGGGGIAVLARHDDPEMKAAVVVTMLPPEEDAIDTSEPREDA